MRVDGIPNVPCSGACSCWPYPDTGDAPASAVTTTATAAASVHQDFKAPKGLRGGIGGKHKGEVVGAAPSRRSERGLVPSTTLSHHRRGLTQPATPCDALYML